MAEAAALLFFSGKIRRMASDLSIELAKRNTNGAEGWTDQEIAEYLDGGKTVDEFAYQFWTEKAASTAHLIDVSEGGSSRSLGNMYSNYLSMADRFRTSETEVTKVLKRTKKAVRR